MGTMLDPFSHGTASTPGGGVSGYASEGDASAYASGRPQANQLPSATLCDVHQGAAATFEARWSVWGAGFGGSQTTDGNATVGSNGVTSRMPAARPARITFIRRIR